VINLCSSLPKTASGDHISNRLVRSATPVGSSYEEARGAESKTDFTHKLDVALKELRETLYWLKIIKYSKMLPAKRLDSMLNEADELCSIFISSCKTAKQSRKRL